MAYVSIGRINSYPGLWLEGTLATAALGGGTIVDAAGEYYAICLTATEDMLVDEVTWRTSTVVTSPTIKIRIETVGTDGIPTGTLWPSSGEFTSGTLVSNTSYNHQLTAQAAISRGSTFAVKWLYNTGGSVNIARVASVYPSQQGAPWDVTNISGSAVKTRPGGLPILGLWSDTENRYYKLQFTAHVNSWTNTVFNNGSATTRRGLRFRAPFGMRAIGIRHQQGTSVGNYEIAIYNDAGALLISTSCGGTSHANVNGGVIYSFFSAAVELAANTWYRAVLIPTTTTNIMLQEFATLLMDAMPGSGSGNQHLTTYAPSTWTDSTTTTLPLMDVLYDQIDVGGDDGGGRAIQINNNSLVA